MIISMIARVSLGHSGRPLQPNKLVSVGFILVLVAALIRSVATAVFPSLTLHFYCVSALLWVLAFLVFVFLYFKILTTPRPRSEERRVGKECSSRLSADHVKTKSLSLRSW